MKRQDSITLLDFTNFLDSGALLRYQDQWFLYGGPFQFVEKEKDSMISVFCPHFYDLEKSSPMRGSEHFVLTRVELIKILMQFLDTQTASTGDPAPSWQEPNPENFDQSFSRIQQLISQSQIDKAVPVVFSSAEMEMTSVLKAKLLLKLIDLPTTLYVYGFWDRQEGILGASPETLFIKEGKKLQSMALAGTLPKAGEYREDQLLKDKKQLSENQIVVKDIVQQLSMYGTVRVQGPYILELPSLWHLKTDIQVQMETEASPIELMKRLHPTPALGVSPRSFGWRWMQELEKMGERKRFGAPILFQIGDDHWVCLVAIRNLQWLDKNWQIGSGCGLVRQSELEKEWEELHYKRESVKKIFGF